MKKILLLMGFIIALPVLSMAAKTLVLIGDATMAAHSITNPDVRGWGEKLPEFFTDKVNVMNFAQAGESTHTLAGERIEKIIRQCQSGDYVLLQLGQNDLREESGSMYYSTSEMAEQLIKIVELLQEKRLTVILSTPVAHPFFLNDTVVNRMGGYTQIIRNVAKLKKIPLIDLEKISTEWLNTIGKDNAPLFFKNVSQDVKRGECLLTEAGATEISRMTAKEILAQKIPYLHKQVVLPIME